MAVEKCVRIHDFSYVILKSRRWCRNYKAI